MLCRFGRCEMIVSPGITSSSKWTAREVPLTPPSGSDTEICSGLTVALMELSSFTLARATSLKGFPSDRATCNVVESNQRMLSRRTSVGSKRVLRITLAIAQTFMMASQPSMSLVGSVSATPNS